MIDLSQLAHIGHIQRTHGTSGELQCRMNNTLWEDNDATFIILSVDSIFVPFRVTDWRTKGSEDVLLTLHGVHTEQHALRFVGCEAYMLLTDLPKQATAYQDLSSLTGFTLCDAVHGEIGTITAIDTSTLNTLVQLDNGTLIPLHEDLVEQIDLTGRRVLTRLPEGLL